MQAGEDDEDEHETSSGMSTREQAIHYLQSIDDNGSPKKSKVISMAMEFACGEGGKDFAKEMIAGIRIAHPDLLLDSASPMQFEDDEPTAPIEGNNSLMSFMQNDPEPVSAPAPATVKKTIKATTAAASPNKQQVGRKRKP